MAFEGVFGGIDFGSGNRMAMAQQQQLQQAIGRGIANYNAGQDRELQRRQLEQQASEFDLGQAAQEALYKQAQGIPLTPQETGAIDAFSVLKGAPVSVDPYGVARSMPTLSERAFLKDQRTTIDGTPLSPQPPPPPLMTEEQFLAAKSPKVTGVLSGTPKGEILEAQAGIDVQKEALREQRAQKNLQKYGGEQLKAANFGNRMRESTKIIESMVGDDPEAQEGKTGFIGGVAKVLTALPLGDTGTGLGEAMIKAGATPKQQMYLNAAQNWVSANLRKESGAAIRVEEMAEEYAKYFPMPLDRKEVKAQKAALRKEAEKGMIGESAGSYQLMFGKKAQAPKTTGGWSIKRK
jgi:hypothetical protein